MATFPGYSYSTPGITDSRFSVENDIGFQERFGITALADPGAIIASTAVDATHAGYTTQLRVGLVMAKVTSSGKWVAYAPTANDGSQIAAGILARECYLIDPTTGLPQERSGLVALGGNLKVANGNLYGLDVAARMQLRNQGFVFDDASTNPSTVGFPYAAPRSVTATATLTSADYGKVIQVVSTANATITLPAVANGAIVTIQNLADFNLVVASAETNNIIAVNDLSATSVGAITLAMKIGAKFRFVGTYVSGVLKWDFTNQSGGSVTITVV